MLKGLGSLQTGTHVNRSLSKTPIVLKRKEYACFSVLSFFCALVSNSGSLLLFALLEIHRWANPSPITTKPPWKKNTRKTPRKSSKSSQGTSLKHRKCHATFSQNFFPKEPNVVGLLAQKNREYLGRESEYPLCVKNIHKSGGFLRPFRAFFCVFLCDRKDFVRIVLFL